MSAAAEEIKQHSLGEVLPWLFLADDKAEDLVVCKDSSLLGCWQFQGVDIEAKGDLDAASNQFDEALRRLADIGAAVWFTMDRRPADKYVRGHFDNPVADFIDAEWAKTFEQNPVYVNTTFLSASMPTVGALSFGELTADNIARGQKPPLAVVNAIKSRIRRKANFGFHTREELDTARTRYANNVANIIDRALPNIDVQRLKGAALLGYLKSTVSASPLAPVAPIHSEYLDAYLSDTFIDNRAQPYIVLDGHQRKYAAVLSLKTAPRGNMLQALNNLCALPVSMRINVCWRSATRSQAERFLSAARAYDEISGLTPRKLIKGVMNRSKSVVNDDDTPTTEVGSVAENYRQLLKRNKVAFGWLAASVVVFADDPKALEEQVDLVGRYLERSGLVFMRERDGSMSGFCVGIPGHVREVVRWHFVEAGNAIDVAPLIALDSGVPYHPFFSEGMPEPLPPNAVLRNRYNTVQYFNNHVNDVGHTLIIGPNGTGKTIMQMFLTAQFQKYPNARAWIIDKDLSCMPATLMLDGQHLDLSPDAGGVRLNPVSVATTEGGRAWLVTWIDRLMSARGNRLTDEELEKVAKAIDLLGVQNDPQARLTSLAAMLPLELRTRLAPWCEGGAFGIYFDNVEDQFNFGRVTCTEVGTVLANGLNDVVAAYCDYAFYRIDRALRDRSEAEVGPTSIYMEESGFFLNDPIFADRAQDYLMTLRKKRAYLTMTAQSPEPFVVNPKLGAAVRDNVATVLFLPNTQATNASLSKQYRQAFGVNDEQLHLIAGATPKLEYCLYQPQTGFFRVCRTGFPKSIIACLRSDAKSQAILKSYYDPEDSQWKDKYYNAVLDA